MSTSPVYFEDEQLATQARRRALLAGAYALGRQARAAAAAKAIAADPQQALLRKQAEADPDDYGVPVYVLDKLVAFAERHVDAVCWIASGVLVACVFCSAQLWELFS